MYPHLIYVMAKKAVRAYQLAALLGISGPALSLKIAGRRGFSISEQMKLSEFFRVSPEWLFAQPSIPTSARTEDTILRPVGLEVR